MEANRKNILNVEEQIKHLKDKNIKFALASEEEAKEYLEKNSNFYKLMAYRKNFSKHPDGDDKEKYINLDFFQLKDLSIIDMRLRYLMLHLALDIEHYVRMRVIRRIETSGSDGYKIVSDYIDSLIDEQKDIFLGEIRRNKNNPYCGSIINKYEDGYPVWAFVEIIPFGRLVSFYKYCADFFKDSEMQDDFYRLLTCKEIRNASAHSSCIINDLRPYKTMHKTNVSISREIMRIDKISYEMRQKKMSNPRIQQIVTLLYVHKDFVRSKGIHNRVCEDLDAFNRRMFAHIDVYSDNEIINSTFDFLKLVIDNWYKVDYNMST